MDKREREQRGGGEGETDFPLSGEPDAGLGLRTLGSRPEPKLTAFTATCNFSRFLKTAVVKFNFSLYCLKQFFYPVWSMTAL